MKSKKSGSEKVAGVPPDSRKPTAVTTNKRERTPSTKTATRTGGPKREGTLAQHQPPTSEEVFAKISTLAYELYERRGRRHGQDLSDWLEAERQVLAQDPFLATLVH